MPSLSRLAGLAAAPSGIGIGEGLNIPALVRDLLGEPNRRASRGSQWRYGGKGSLAVDVAAGRFMDFETGEGGGLLDLVRRVRGGSRADAARWLEGQTEASPTAHRKDGNAGLLYGKKGMTPRKNKPQQAGGGWESIRSPLARDPVPDVQADPGGWLRIWQASQPPEGSPVARYLEGRGLSLPAEPGRVLRYHPACPFGPDKLPAMVALIRNAETGEPQGLHRTPLTPTGARARGADGAKLPKMMLGAASGGAVMLSPNWQVETSLAIAEGVESALAGLRRQPWLPTWAALSAGGVKGFPLLSGIEALTVYADNDAAGIDASRALCLRYAEAGRYAEMVRPRATGKDLADLISRHATRRERAESPNDLGKSGCALMGKGG